MEISSSFELFVGLCPSYLAYIQLYVLSDREHSWVETLGFLTLLTDLLDCLSILLVFELYIDGISYGISLGACTMRAHLHAL